MADGEKPNTYPSTTPGTDTKERLSGLKQGVEELSTTPHERAERKIGKNFMDILRDNDYLRTTHIDGTTKEVLKAKTEEEAVKMVNEIVDKFERFLWYHPDIFKEFPKPIMFQTTFKEMLIHTTDGGNFYWDIDVVANGDNVKVTAPLRMVG